MIKQTQTTKDFVFNLEKIKNKTKQNKTKQNKTKKQKQKQNKNKNKTKTKTKKKKETKRNIKQSFENKQTFRCLGEEGHRTRNFAKIFGK
jgi:hypothetical protein